MKILSLHQIHVHDGGGHTNASIVHTTSKELADKIGKSPGLSTEQHIIVVETEDDIPQIPAAKSLIAALKKLSPADRQALGIPKDLSEAVAKLGKSNGVP